MTAPPDPTALASQVSMHTPPAGARPPGPRRGWPVTPLLAFRRDPLAYLTALARTHGDVAHVRAGPVRFWLLSHPELVRDVLVTQQRRFRGLAFEAVRRVIGDGLLSVQGEQHRRQRRLVQPAFHRERLAVQGAIMAQHGRRWRDARRDGETLPLRQAMMELTLGVVGEAMFGARELDAADDVRQLVDEGIRLFTPLTLPVARWIERLPTPTARRFVRARAALDRRIARMVAERRAARAAGTAVADDLLSLLLEARDDEDATSQRAPQRAPQRSAQPAPQRVDGPAASPLGDAWVRDEMLTVFVAGHETTASALTWCWTLLADHPAAERRLHDELDAVLGDRSPTADDVPRLPWTRACFQEALRLWPTVPFLFRRAIEPHDALGWTIPRGDVVVLSPWVVQRDARWWTAPDAFCPERWLDEATARERPRFAWFPFGGGARVCIGEHFAQLEGALLLAIVAQRWRLVRDGPSVPPTPALGTRPPDAVRVRVAARGRAYEAAGSA